MLMTLQQTERLDKVLTMYDNEEIDREQLILKMAEILGIQIEFL